MSGLLHHRDLDADAAAYRIFGLGRDAVPWRVADILATHGPIADDDRAVLAWRVASRGYYAEQAGLIAAATLAAGTDDAPLRFSLATAASDEARHADAFYQYARRTGGEPEEAMELLEPLHEGLDSLPYLGKVLVHTMLEGFAADEFVLLAEVFAGDPLGLLYRYVRRDEIRHIAIGLNYLSRASSSARTREAWLECGAGWMSVGMELTHVGALARSLGELTSRDPQAVRAWFLRRHEARLRAAGVIPPKGGDPP